MTQTVDTAKQEAGNYNTTTIAAQIAKVHGTTRAEALRIIDTFATIVTNGVASGETVRIHNFGNFKKVDTKARTGRNPQSGESVEIAASARPHFTSSAAMKNAVKNGVVVAIEVKKPVAAEAEDAAPKAAAPKAAAPKAAAPAKKKAPAPKPAPAAPPIVEDFVIEDDPMEETEDPEGDDMI